MNLSEHQLKMLEVIAEVTPNILLRRYKDVNCCIAATRIIIEVLKKLHFRDIKPFVVEANIFNETYVKKGRMPESHEEAEQWLGEGAWQVVLGDRSQEIKGRWPGHLTIVIKDHYLLDVAIFQASRPHKNINLHPILTTVPEDFIKGEDKCGLMFLNCMVVYVAHPEDKTYQATRDWWDVSKSKEVVSEVYNEVKTILGKKK